MLSKSPPPRPSRRGDRSHDRRVWGGADDLELSLAPHPSSALRSRDAKQERREQQPAGDSALAAAARRSGLSEQEVFDLAVARSAWKNTVMVQLGAGNTRLVWSRTPLPALENLGEMHHAVAFRSIDWSRVLLNDSAPTDLERADGNWAPAIRKLSGKLSGPRPPPPSSHSLQRSTSISPRRAGSPALGPTTGGPGC